MFIQTSSDQDSDENKLKTVNSRLWSLTPTKFWRHTSTSDQALTNSIKILWFKILSIRIAVTLNKLQQTSTRRFQVWSTWQRYNTLCLISINLCCQDLISLTALNSILFSQHLYARYVKTHSIFQQLKNLQWLLVPW